MDINLDIIKFVDDFIEDLEINNPLLDSFYSLDKEILYQDILKEVTKNHGITGEIFITIDQINSIILSNQDKSLDKSITKLYEMGLIDISGLDINGNFTYKINEDKNLIND